MDGPSTGTARARSSWKKSFFCSPRPASQPHPFSTASVARPPVVEVQGTPCGCATQILAAHPHDVKAVRHADDADQPILPRAHHAEVRHQARVRALDGAHDQLRNASARRLLLASLLLRLLQSRRRSLALPQEAVHAGTAGPPRDPLCLLMGANATAQVRQEGPLGRDTLYYSAKETPILSLAPRRHRVVDSERRHLRGHRWRAQRKSARARGTLGNPNGLAPS